MGRYRITKTYKRSQFCDVEADSLEEALKASVDSDAEWEWDDADDGGYWFDCASWQILDEDDEIEDEGELEDDQMDAVKGFYDIRQW